MTCVVFDEALHAIQRAVLECFAHQGRRFELYP